MSQKYVFKKLLQRDIKVILNKQKVMVQVRDYKALKSGTWFNIF